jgi:hypothetical protein
VSTSNKIKRTLFILSLSIKNYRIENLKPEGQFIVPVLHLCHDVFMSAVTKPSPLMKHALLYKMNWVYMTTPEKVLPPLAYRVHVEVFCTPSQHNIYCFELVSTGVSYVGWMWVVNQRHPNIREQTVVVNTEVTVRRLYSVVNNREHLRSAVLNHHRSDSFPCGASLRFCLFVAGTDRCHNKRFRQICIHSSPLCFSYDIGL